MEKLIEISVAIKKLSVSESTIRRMIRDPDCPLQGIRVYRGVIRIPIESLNACLQPIPKASYN